MKKAVVSVLASVLVSLFFLAAADCQEDMLEVSDSAFEQLQRPPAVFRHDQHNENAGIEECSVCHHVYEDGQRVEDESSEDQSCSECHGLKAAGSTPGLMKAFHDQCWGCHQRQQKGPVMCGQCHVRRRAGNG